MYIPCPLCEEAEGSDDECKTDTTLPCKHTINSSLVPPTIYECAQLGLLDELQRLLLQRSKTSEWSVNTPDNQNATLLHWASFYNQLHVIKYLLALPHINVNAVGGDLLSTPLYWAAHRNNIQAVALLLDHHADPTIADKHGFDAYFVAVQSGYTILSAFFIAKGCNIDTPSQDADRLTPLMWLCRYKFELDTARMLFGLGANVHETDAHGNTALHLAATSDFVVAAKYLLDRGVDIHAKNKRGQTALDIANDVASDIETRTSGKRTAATVGLLRSVYRYDESYNTLPVSVLKRHAGLTAFWTPWFVMGLIGVAAHKLDGRDVVVGIAASVAFGYWLVKVAGLDVNPSKLKYSRLMFGVNVHSIFWITFGVALLVAEGALYVHATMVFFVFFTGTCVCVYWTTTTSPGLLSTTIQERHRNVMDLVAMHSRPEVKFCSTCLQHRPLRSKHNVELNACVARFDHFCTFVANVVGANNHTFYFGFLFNSVMGIGVYLAMIVDYLAREGVLNEPTYWRTLARVGHNYPVVLSISILAAVHIVWIGGLLVANIYGILFTWTTNERVLQSRSQAKTSSLHSKFSRGVVQNVVDFFHFPLGDELDRIDWRRCRFYSLDELHARPSKAKLE
ncbi:hypothetical protein Ae201684P_010941 [Aphanomyces euteiches]|uniref:Palmitoyltransferase n=1 Tax=Aphanomyces euteiches TaxID=100861 RepID=A0A6G0XXP6_9STRA|nr:hypothetical protein Ae201684_000505 [Aphanomyces euteiches]KAH9091394.1 hypothetical protein Ae201684P_010941 [Aphanomyces euteiches]